MNASRQTSGRTRQCRRCGLKITDFRCIVCGDYDADDHHGAYERTEDVACRVRPGERCPIEGRSL